MTYVKKARIWFMVSIVALVVIYFALMQYMLMLNNIQDSRCDENCLGHTFRYSQERRTEKWGKAWVERCEDCGMERLHLIGWESKSGFSPVFMIRKWWWSEEFDIYYYEWRDPNKPEIQWTEITDESEIVENEMGW